MYTLFSISIKLLFNTFNFPTGKSQRLCKGGGEREDGTKMTFSRPDKRGKRAETKTKPLIPTKIFLTPGRPPG